MEEGFLAGVATPQINEILKAPRRVRTLDGVMIGVAEPLAASLLRATVCFHEFNRIRRRLHRGVRLAGDEAKAEKEAARVGRIGPSTAAATVSA